MTLAIIVAYLIGSVPFALLLSQRWSATDLRTFGSGNLGAANVLRASGVRAGVLVAVLDAAKGAASVALAMRISNAPIAPAAAGFAAIIGHIYPVWLKFKGGKGVATACGVFSVLTPLAVPPSLVVFLVAVWRASTSRSVRSLRRWRCRRSRMRRARRRRRWRLRSRHRC